jgi:hypothetical protein
MRIAAYKHTHPPIRRFLKRSGDVKRAAVRGDFHRAGVTLTETLISLMIVVIGLSGLFASGAQSYRLLRRAKEEVAVRECLLTRLDSIRALSFTEVARPVPPSSSSSTLSNTGSLSTNLIVTGDAGDPNPFGGVLSGVKNFKETVTVYALGAQLFSSDSQRSAATPDYATELGSQVDPIAPAAPKTYLANSTKTGDWTLQVAGALPYFTITRVGTGANAQVTVDTSTSSNFTPSNDLSVYPALRVDVTYSWTDSSNNTRTQVGSMIVARNGSLQ